jgi:simple sugar transport system permease protein
MGQDFLTQVASVIKLILLTMVPYVLSSQGTMLGGRTGVYIVAQEGIMLVGASLGFVVSFLTGSLVYGLLASIFAGALFGLALAYFTTTLKMNQFVIGLSLYFVGLGLSTLIPKLVIGVTLKPPLIPTLDTVAIPGLVKIPFIGDVLFNQNWLMYFSILLTIGLYYFMYKTQAGLELRSVGENPKAADSLGINVNLRRYVAVIVGCALMGLAGAYLPMVFTGTFTEGMVNGRGWLSSALAFFGGWSPHLIFFGSLFFAGIEVLAFRVQMGSSFIPYQFLLMLPYLATIVVMMVSFKRSKVPAFLGKNYDREKRTI